MVTHAPVPAAVGRSEGWPESRDAGPADTLGRVTNSSPQPTDRASRVAAAVLGAQALALVGFTVFYLVGVLRGASDDTSRAVMSMVLFVLVAVGLVALARGLWQAAPWARTPTLVWLALLLPVSWGMFQSGAMLLGALVLATALAGIVAVALASRHAQDAAG